MATSPTGGAFGAQVRIVLRAQRPRVRIVRRLQVRIVLRIDPVETGRYLRAWNRLSVVEQIAAWRDVFAGKPRLLVVQAIVDADESEQP